MQQRPLGASGLAVSRFALGTMTWGADTDPDDAAGQLKIFLDAGGTLVDTADVYADGQAEAVLGALLDGTVRRDEVVIVTKAGLRPGTARARDASRGHLLRALDASLRRLGTDHVDVWQVHGHDPLTPLTETLSALDHAVQSGKARYVGVCDLPAWRLAQAATWQAAWPGRAPVVATAAEYSLLARELEAEVLPAARGLGLGVLVWSPLGRGVLTGKYRRDRPPDSRATSPQLGAFVAEYLNPRCSPIVEAVATAGAGLGVAPLAVALAWIRDRPGVTAPVLGARTGNQLAAALRADALALPDEIARALDDASATAAGGWGG